MEGRHDLPAACASGVRCPGLPCAIAIRCGSVTSVHGDGSARRGSWRGRLGFPRALINFKACWTSQQSIGPIAADSEVGGAAAQHFVLLRCKCRWHTEEGRDKTAGSCGSPHVGQSVLALLLREMATSLGQCYPCQRARRIAHRGPTPRNDACVGQPVIQKRHGKAVLRVLHGARHHLHFDGAVGCCQGDSLTVTGLRGGTAGVHEAKAQGRREHGERVRSAHQGLV